MGIIPFWKESAKKDAPKKNLSMQPPSHELTAEWRNTRSDNADPHPSVLIPETRYLKEIRVKKETETADPFSVASM